jgi:hypothetical protein
MRYSHSVRPFDMREGKRWDSQKPVEMIGENPATAELETREGKKETGEAAGGPRGRNSKKGNRDRGSGRRAVMRVFFIL